MLRVSMIYAGDEHNFVKGGGFRGMMRYLGLQRSQK